MPTTKTGPALITKTFTVGALYRRAMYTVLDANECGYKGRNVWARSEITITGSARQWDLLLEDLTLAFPSMDFSDLTANFTAK